MQRRWLFTIPCGTAPEQMANAIASGFSDVGVDVRPMHLRKWHRSDIMTEVLDAGAVVVGSPTLNNGFVPDGQ